MTSSIVCLVLLLGAQDADNRLKPAATVAIDASIGEMALSNDRAWVYLLNLSDAKVQRLDAAKRDLDAASLPLAEYSRAMAMSPNGKALVVAASTGTPNDGMGPPPGAPQGKIQLVDTATFQLKRSTSVEFWPYRVAVTDSGTIFAAGKPRMGAGAVVVLEGGKVGRKIERSSESCYPLLSPDQKWIYLAPGAFCRAPVSGGKGDLPPNYFPASLPETLAGGPFILSPDGAFLVGGRGAVINLVKPTKESNNLAAKVVMHLAAILDAEIPKLLLVTTADATLKIYSVPGFELKRSYVLDAPLYHAVLDGKTRMLYGAAHAGERSLLSPGTNGLGKIHLYDLSKVIEEASK